MAEVTKIDFDDSDKYKSIDVEKNLELQIDVGTLLAIDVNDLDLKKLRTHTNEYLASLARDNTQLLLNEVWKLPTTRVDEAIVAELPKPEFVLPREKPIPRPKPLTKWQQYAKDKGLKKTKKANLTWDDILKKWVPRHGYKRAAAQKEKDWVIEVPQNADPYEDMFEKKSKEKQEKVSKNEYQRLRNIAKAKNIKVPTMGLPPTEKLSSLQLNSAATIANVSTASLGKFQPRLSKEKTLSKKSILQTKKRKMPHLTGDEEHKNYMNIADKILNKKPKIDIDKAVNMEMSNPNSRSEEEGEGRPRKKGKKGGGGGKRKGKSSFGDSKGMRKQKSSTGGQHKNFSGKGKAGGRKRR